jgi:L-ascorbate metabolism protein UlaG (beta-lactamase superfamily)
MRRKLLIAAAIVLVAAAAWLAKLRNDHPSLDAWNEHVLPAAADVEDGAVTVRYYGVSTLVFSDGDETVIIDGFLTRPGGLLRVMLGADVEPDEDKIRRILLEDGIGRAAVVACVHSHYDHSMDAPVVAARTGAVLMGSRSTANVGRGWGLPDDRILIAKDGDTHSFGEFKVTFVRSQHVPLPFGQSTIGEEILSPLVPPTGAMTYLEGGSYSILVEHPLGTALVHGSAGWKDGALDGYRADTVFLGIAGLSGQDETYRNTYLEQVLGASAAHRVIPIHFDDFTLELGDPGSEQPAMPMLADDIPATLDFVFADAAARGLDFALLPLREKVVIFER